MSAAISPSLSVCPVRIGPDALVDLHALRPQRYPALLESTAHGPLGRCDILFAFPQQRLTLQAEGGLESDVPNLAQHTDFLGALDQWWSQERAFASEPRWPFDGGWFLLLGYELAGQIESSLTIPRAQSGLIAEAVRIP